jgi:hypothetical protein
MVEFSGNFIRHGSSRSSRILGDCVERVPVFFRNVEGLIYSANVSLEQDGRTRSAGRMIVKDQGIDALYDMGFCDAWPEVIAEKYAWLRAHGFPVVPTLLVDVETNKVIMTDVSEDGCKKIIDKHNPLETQLDLKNKNSVKQELLSIAENAYAEGNGVFLGADAFAVVVDNRRIGKVVLLDLGLQTWRVKNHTPVSFGLSASLQLSLDEVRQSVNNFLRYAEISF